ncbi:MAG: hypothetical protein ACLR2G_11005 [Phascolarctobacterium faecium]
MFNAAGCNRLTAAAPAVAEMIVEAVVAYCPAAVKADFKAVLPQNPFS